MKQRILWHVIFWLGYTSLYAYLNTAFPAPSDLEYDWAIRYWRFLQTEWIMLPLKLIATYAFLYWVVPRFVLTGQYGKAILATLALLLPLTLLSRVMTYYAVYPFLYGEHPTYEMVSVRRMLFSLLDIASAMTIAATASLLRRRMEAQRREEELSREKLQSELNFLRARTNPHFLFNTLNNIYALARKQSEQTAPVVMRLSQLLRFMLYECAEPRIPISKEVKVIQDYIELEQLRYNERLQVRLEQVLDDPQQPIAPLLLLPLVENAFKYGVSETRFDAEVIISIEMKQQKLSVYIKNASPIESSEEKEGIGLSSIRRQLTLIYPEAHELNMEKIGEQHHLSLSVDLSKETSL